MHDSVINWSEALNGSPAFNTQLKDLTVDVRQLSLVANAKPSSILLSAGLNGTQEVKFARKIAPATVTVNEEASIEELSLARYQPYPKKMLTADISASFYTKY
ncbi:MAG: DUF748 domain-containing protein [Glaciimonas sp.]|nr:DUF748 domain-containing protein [Glaciimonas sp.]